MNLVLLIVLLLFSTPLHAQTPQIFPFFQDGKIGYINRQGTVVLPAQFDTQSPAFLVPEAGEGLYALKKDGAVGYFDISGNAVIKPAYDWGYPFQSGYAIVSKNNPRGKSDPLSGTYEWGVINREGGYVIKPQKGQIERHDGLLLVKTWLPPAREYRYDLLTLSGEIITSSQIAEEFTAESYERKNAMLRYRLTFHEDLIPSAIQGKFGYKNRQNGFEIKPHYEDARHFSEGLAAVRSGGLWGFIDRSGKTVIAPRFDAVHVIGFSSAHCFVKSEGRWGWINRQGQFRVKPVFDDIKQENFHEGLIGVKQNGKWGFMDSTGVVVIRPQFQDVGHFSEGYGMIHADRGKNFNDRKGYGFINRKGTVLLKPTKVHASDFRDGWAWMVHTASEGRDAFPVDRAFKEIIPDQLIAGSQDSLWVLQDSRHGGKYGLYDWKKRQYLIEPKYLKMILTGADIVFVILRKTDRDFEYAYLDFSGAIIFRATATGKIRF